MGKAEHDEMQLVDEKDLKTGKTTKSRRKSRRKRGPKKDPTKTARFPKLVGKSARDTGRLL